MTFNALSNRVAPEEIMQRQEKNTDKAESDHNTLDSKDIKNRNEDFQTVSLNGGSITQRTID